MITSLQNSTIKDVVRLRTRRGREAGECIIVEGEREVARARAQGVVLRRVFFCSDLASESGREVAKDLKLAGVELLECTAPVFEKMAYREGPDGLLALAVPPVWTLDRLSLSVCPLILVAEGIEKPGNLGALLRSADAVNADAVLVCDSVTDLFNPNVIRASTGTLFSRPVVQTSSGKAAAWLKEHTIQIAAALPEANEIYHEADLTGPVALVLGAEHDGVSTIWRDAADIRLSIPMCGQADSLNVSAAGVLLLYEALRQRAG